MTYATGSFSYDVGAIRENAPELQGPETVVADPNTPNVNTFWWRVSAPKIGNTISALSDVTVIRDSPNQVEFVDTAPIIDVTLNQLYLNPNTGTYEFISISDTQRLPDQVLASEYSGAVAPDYFGRATIKPGNSGGGFVNEFYVSVTVDPALTKSVFVDGEHLTIPNMGRFLVTDGQVTGARDLAWGNWLDETSRPTPPSPIPPPSFTPTGLDDPTIQASTRPFGELAAGTLVEDTKDEPAAQSFEKVEFYKDLAETSISLAESTGELAEIQTKVPLSESPGGFVRVWNKGNPYNAEAFKELGETTAKVSAAISGLLAGYQQYQKTGSIPQALGVGGLKAAVALLSGEAGAVIGAGLAETVGVAVASAVAAGTVPVILGAGIVIGSGILAGTVVQVIADKGVDAVLGAVGPSWWPGAKPVAKAVALDATLAPAQATTTAPATTAPKWVYNLDTGQLTASLSDTDPAAFAAAAKAFAVDTRVFTTVGFSGLDTTTNTVLASGMSAYSGPVSGLTSQFVSVTPDNLSIAVSSSNWFIHTGAGNDAIDVSKVDGTNILDGGTGSNFLVGGSGHDTFFVDDRGPTADIWSTIVNFHGGDAVTVWGINPTDFALTWLDGQGASGATGLTASITRGGSPNANVTLAGYSKSDIGSSLSINFGRTSDLPGAPGSSFMSIAHT